MLRLGGCEYLSVGSSGPRGVGYLGVLSALEEHSASTQGVSFSEWVQNLKGLIGTSGGSILCLCLVLGMEVSKIEETLSEPLSSLRSIAPCVDVGLLYSSFGMETGEAFRSYCREIIRSSGIQEDVTLSSLHKLTKKDFVCVTTNLTQSRVEYLSHLTTPHLKVVDAVYMSCCVPILFTPFEWEGSLYVDGVLSDNLPFHHFPKEKTFVLGMTMKRESDIRDMRTYVHRLIMLSTHLKPDEEYVPHQTLLLDLEESGPPANFDMQKAEIQSLRGKAHLQCLSRLYPSLLKVAGGITLLVSTSSSDARQTDETRWRTCP